VAALLGGLVACAPEVVIGADGLQSCPPEPWTPRAVATVADLKAGLLSRWLFCGGERRETGRGALQTFFGGDGVAFWEQDGGVRYAFLGGGGASLQCVEAWCQGTVALDVQAGLGRATLVASDGIDTVWNLELFDEPRVLTNRGFDVWHFVPVAPTR
jgi:hypothetical protein